MIEPKRTPAIGIRTTVLDVLETVPGSFIEHFCGALASVRVGVAVGFSSAERGLKAMQDRDCRSLQAKLNKPDILGISEHLLRRLRDVQGLI